MIFNLNFESGFEVKMNYSPYIKFGVILEI